MDTFRDTCTHAATYIWGFCSTSQRQRSTYSPGVSGAFTYSHAKTHACTQIDGETQSRTFTHAHSMKTPGCEIVTAKVRDECRLQTLSTICHVSAASPLVAGPLRFHTCTPQRVRLRSLHSITRSLHSITRLRHSLTRSLNKFPRPRRARLPHG